MVRAFRLLFLLGCGFALIATSAGAANTTKPKVPAPLGQDIYGSEFSFLSNNGWDLADGNAAKMVLVNRKADRASESAWGRQDDAYIWARNCTPGAQKVVFSRVYDIPGTPTSFNGTLWATNSGYPQGPSQPLINIRVFINGTLIATADGSKVTTASAGFVIPPNPNHAKLLRRGPNEIKVEVNKRAQNAANNKCMYSATTPLGVRFVFNGKFAADLAMKPVQRDTYWKYDTWPAIVMVRDRSFLNNIRNRGVADAHFSRLTITVSSAETSKVELYNISSSRGPCETKIQAQAGHLECAMNDMPVGGPYSGPTYYTKVHFGPLNYARIAFFATISSRLTDPMFSNNQRQEFIHVCGPGSTSIKPECAGAEYPPPILGVSDMSRAVQ